MASDALASDTARRFVDSLTAEGKQEFKEALDELLRDPQPNGVNKVALPFPYRPGVYGYATGEFWIAYTFLNPEVLYLVAIYWSPSSPSHPLNRSPV